MNLTNTTGMSHLKDLFSTSVARFPGGNKETVQQLRQVTRHPGKFRNDAFQNT